MLIEVNLLHIMVELKMVKINKSRSLDYWYVRRRPKCDNQGLLVYQIPDSNMLDRGA